MGRQSCPSCTLPSPTPAGSHHVRARPSSASSKSRFSGTEQRLALPKGVCSLKMLSLRPSSPYNLSLRCVPGAWAVMGSVCSRCWELRTGRGVEGPTYPIGFLLSVKSIPLSTDTQDTGGPRSLPPALGSLPTRFLSQPLSLIANVVAGSSCRGPPLPRDLQGSRHRAEVASALRSFSPLHPGQVPTGRAPSTMTGSG